jgi:4-aminobutyrate aminotransferase
MQNALEVGEYTLDGLEEIKSRHSTIGDVRGIGLMIGIEFVKDQTNKLPAEELRDRIIDLAFERGLLTLGCGNSVIRVSPPLSINKNELDEGLEILEEAIMLAEKEYS